MAFSLMRFRSVLGLMVLGLTLTLVPVQASAQELTAFAFGTDLIDEGNEPDLVASGLAVQNMTLTQNLVTPVPLTYDEGSVGRGAVTEGGWGPHNGDNYFETVLTVTEPGTIMRLTNFVFDFKAEQSAGHVVQVSMIANGEEPVVVFSLAGGGPPEWRHSGTFVNAYVPLNWPPLLARRDLQSLVIRVHFDPTRSDAIFGLDEVIVYGQVLVSSGVDDQPLPASAGVLGQNQPNPFNPRTSISFNLERAGTVSLRVYDLQGREIRTLVDGFRDVGTHSVTWNGRDGAGRASASGIYAYRIRTQDGVEVRRMTLLQ